MNGKKEWKNMILHDVNIHGMLGRGHLIVLAWSWLCTKKKFVGRSSYTLADYREGGREGKEASSERTVEKWSSDERTGVKLDPLSDL